VGVVGVVVVVIAVEDLGSSWTHYDLNCLVTSSAVVVLFLQSICVSSFILVSHSLWIHFFPSSKTLL